LKFKCILNGCVSNVKAQAEELNGFIQSYLKGEANQGSTILFCANKEDRHKLLGLVPTDRVELARVNRFQPETILDALQRIEDNADTVLYLFPGGFRGSEITVRWAFRRKGASLVQVEQIECIDDGLIVKKKAYADHVLATFRLTQQPFCISLAKGSVDRLPIEEKGDLTIIEHDLTGLNRDGFVRDYQWIPTEQANHLEATRLLIVGGRGLDNKENVKQLKDMADEVGAGFGISRPVALNAWGPMHWLVGVSGAIAKPEICIAAGVSGAAAFYAGIEKSNIIIAINIDPHARIIKAADVVIIDDYKAVMDELLKIFMLDCTNDA
jgi:electron transfer flavoprotein alpha subunit